MRAAPVLIWFVITGPLRRVKGRGDGAARTFRRDGDCA